MWVLFHLYVRQCDSVCCSMLHYVAVCCSVSQCVTVWEHAICSTCVCTSVMQCVAVRYSVSQCVVWWCSVVQQKSDPLRRKECHWWMPCAPSVRVAVCCSRLQCVAVCYSVLQCLAMSCNVVLQCCSTVQCSVLQCVAVCHNMSQCVAVYCMVLQCDVAVRYSVVMQCVAMSKEVMCTPAWDQATHVWYQTVAVCGSLLQFVVAMSGYNMLLCVADD